MLLLGFAPYAVNTRFVVMALKLQQRTRSSKARVLRRSGLLPGVLYGVGKGALPVTAAYSDFVRFVQRGSHGFVQVELEGKTLEGILQEHQRHPVSGAVIHFDVYIPRADRPVKTTVPFVFVGESPATKSGGIVVKSMDGVEVEGFPRDIPAELHVDLARVVSVHQTLYMRDVTFPPGVKPLVAGDTPIVTIIEEASERVEEPTKAVSETEVSEKK